MSFGAVGNMLLCGCPGFFNKPGSGLFGRLFSLSGARRTLDPDGNFLVCGSPAGGCQSLPLPGTLDEPSNLLGLTYDPKGPVGYLVDTFAGPHDWLRDHISRSYNELGNSKYFAPGSFRQFVDRVANAALIPVAAPIAVATLIGTQPILYRTALEYANGD